MSDEIKINRITQSNPKADAPSVAPQAEAKEQRAASKTPWLALAVVIIVLAVLGVLFREKLFPKAGNSQGSAASNKVSKYQAVFLTNGQVYFGKLSNTKGDYVVMEDIYYLQVGPQQGSGSQTQPNQAQPQQEIRLVKLGDELHGPVDKMHINNSQILFYEDLKEDGQVVRAIVQDKNSKK